MAKADRLEIMDARRAEQEVEYTDALLAALRATAAGTWGLFDHNQDRMTRAKIAPVVDNLTDLADSIDAMRDKLGLEPFALHQEFLRSRGKAPSHAVGEPKQARAWLDRLEA
ncbi:MAG: hypothetical protein EOP61_20305 [Sphingomonadales bacterium]|nr:MAG: hypothetical protein EOP61_20305 [Sphingomonadales bacterium]